MYRYREGLPTPPITPFLDTECGFDIVESPQRIHRVNGQYVFVNLPKVHHTVQRTCATSGPFLQIPHHVFALNYTMADYSGRNLNSTAAERENRTHPTFNPTRSTTATYDLPIRRL